MQFILRVLRQAMMDSTFVAMFPYVITNYGGSLVYGHRYIFHSMPRMLTLWLDFGADVARQQNSKERTDEKTKNVRSYPHRQATLPTARCL